MVNGNYILYGDRPPSESTYIEDHVIEKTDKKNKRKTNRNANDLHRTLNLAQIDNETDSIKYEKKKKEPKLLRYVPNTEIEEHTITDKFEGAEMKTIDEKPKRYGFSKRQKNPSDGSVHYAYSRSSSGCSSPNGNLPTISEHGDQFPGYSADHVNPVESTVPFDKRFEKYFAKPKDLKQLPSKGSNPDSLYRVPIPANGGNKAARVLRSIRWVIAAVIICAALTAFIFYLMPLQDEATANNNKKINETLWNSEVRHPYNDRRNENKITNKKQPQLHLNNGTKTSEIDFYDAPSVENPKEPELHVHAILEPIKEKDILQEKKRLPGPIIFPTHVTAEVKYGNEKVDDEPKRTSKYINSDGDDYYEDATLKPHITQKPEKPLAIYFKDGEVLTSVENISTKIHTFSHDDVDKNVTTDNSNRDLENNISDVAIPDVKFTSGHSKIFGISIEDAEKLKITTQSSLYNTKVSPTLPAWRSLADTTTAKYPVNSAPESQPQCRSTSLHMCRGILPYDLAGSPVSPGRVVIEDLVPQMEYMLTSNCSDRLRHFFCALLEPECGPKPEMPCYNLCKVVSDSCEGLIPQQLLPLFRCKQYPSRECAPVRAPCYSREMPCGDNTCVPRDWMCDGTSDCPAGEDEAPCSACAKNEFKCPSGGCIQSRWVCDGYTDCGAGEDETAEMCGGRGGRRGGDGQGGDLQGGDAQGSAPAPAVHPHNTHQNNRYADIENSKEILMTSGTSNGLRRNYTRRPAASRLTPYHRPGLKEHKPTEEIKDKVQSETKNAPVKETEEDLTVSDVNLFDEELGKDKGNGGKTVAMEAISPPKPAKIISQPTTTVASTRIDQNGNFERTFNGGELLKLAQEQAAKEAAPVDDSPDYEPLNFGKKSNTQYNSHQAPCASSDLRCVDGRCITLAQLCDGTIDCSDHADEDNCYT